MSRSTLLALCAVILAGLLAAAWYGSRPRAPGEPVDIDFARAHEAVGKYVRLTGMAHYAAVVRQDVPPALFQDARSYWLFGFFEMYDTEGRAITMVVRSPEEPEHLVHYELMTVEGWLERATPDKVPFEAEVILGKNSDYFFADDMLLLDAHALDPAGDGGG